MLEQLGEYRENNKGDSFEAFDFFKEMQTKNGNLEVINLAE